jgi:hypothetical protein
MGDTLMDRDALPEGMPTDNHPHFLVDILGISRFHPKWATQQLRACAKKREQNRYD